jgi:hypothetical protein
VPSAPSTERRPNSAFSKPTAPCAPANLPRKRRLRSPPSSPSTI